MYSAAEYQQLINTNPYLKKFLDLIGWAEGATYNTGFGNRFIASLSWHPYAPRQFSIIDPVSGKQSTTSAAGKYQYQRGTWESVARQLGLKDFSPISQDIGAVALIDQSGQLQNVLSGNIQSAVSGLGGVWQSFKTRPLNSILQKFGVSVPAPESTTDSGAATPINFDVNAQVIGQKNRYLIAFFILVVVFIFAFKQ